MKRLRRMIVVLAALCLVLCAVSAQAAANPKWVKRAVSLISYFESRGDYGCAHNVTNGLPSLGFLQWNGNRTMTLLNRIIDEDKAQAQEILGDAFFAKVNGATTWSGRMSTSQLTAATKLLKTDAGIRVQDALAANDVAVYLEKGMALGIKDATALVYYADIRHQVGSGAIVKYQELAAKKAGSYGEVKLKHLYDAEMNFATHTASRRKTAYQKLLEDPVGGSTGDEEGGNSGSGENGQAVLPTRVTLGNAAVTLYMNETLALKPTLRPANATSTYTWSSSNRKIATVKGGLVTPVKQGKATVRVRTENGLTATLRIRVKAVLAQSVALEGEPSMKVGGTQQLTATVLPSDATRKAVRYRSSNPKIAKVSKTGKVKALRAGKVTISCQTTDGSKRMGRLKITIKK